MTLTKTLSYGKGYTGKSGNKCWIAEITGTDKQYGLTRSFLEPTKVEREHFNRPRTMVNFTYELPAGLYECSQSGERWIIIVWIKGGKAEAFRPSDERIKAMLTLMDQGMSADDARRATKPAPVAPVAEVVNV